MADASRILDTVKLRGYSARLRRGEVQVQSCWFCGNDRWNLELSASKGVYKCWACLASGRLDGLLNSHFDLDLSIPVNWDSGKQGGQFAQLEEAEQIPSVPASQVQSASNYLEHRGFPNWVVDQYGLRVATQKTHSFYGRLLIPMHDYWEHQHVGWQARSYTGERPKYLTTLSHTIMAGWWHRREPERPHVLVEGAFDAIAVHRGGHNAAFSSGTGGSHVLHWADRLPPQAPLIIMLDGSARKEAEKLYWTLQPLHPLLTRVTLPEEADPASLHPRALSKLIEFSIQNEFKGAA